MNTNELSEKILNGEVLTPEEREVAASVVRFGDRLESAVTTSKKYGGTLTLSGYRTGESSEQGSTPTFFIVASDDPHPDTWGAVQQAVSPEEGDPLDPLVSILTRMSAAHQRYRTEANPRVHEEEIELCQQDLLELLSREDGPALDFRRLAAWGTSTGHPDLTPEQNAFEAFGRAWESLQVIERGLDTDGPGFSHYTAIQRVLLAAAALRETLGAAPAIQELREKARLWDAFLGAGRLRMFGWAGSPDDKEIHHFGAEFWVAYPGYDFTETNARARELITAFARTAADAQAETCRNCGAAAPLVQAEEGELVCEACVDTTAGQEDAGEQ